MVEAVNETDLSPTAEETVDGEEKYNLSPPKALFLPSPNHPFHILVSKQCTLFKGLVLSEHRVVGLM